jgi:hypothetical protein
MTVSVTEGHSNVDLDAIVAGGDAFMARVKTLQQEKAAHGAALKALNIGNDAVAAMRGAQAREQQAIKLVEEAKLEAEAIMAAATARAEKLRIETQIAADGLMADANSASAAIEQEVKVARAALNAWSDKTRAEIDALMAYATDTKADAEQQLVDNRQAAEALAKAKAQADAKIVFANATQAALNAKLEAIKAAASR